ncbi:MAG: iron-containing redox enzyme family protein [Acidimicrobiales bacterium]
MSTPSLPPRRGPLSAWLLRRLRQAPHELNGWPDPVGDPIFGEDAALSLYLCYELHYRGFGGVDPEWEWAPSLLRIRAELESRFIEALRARLPNDPYGAPVSPAEVAPRLDAVLARPGPSLSTFVADQGTRRQFQEFAVHRSAYQLKEADPHTWAIPRLHGASKAALCAIQHDEYGEGRPERMHAYLFAQTLRSLELCDAYGAYLPSIPGVTLATVNLISLFGLHRRWRGALVGHLAIFEMASVGPNGAYARALTRLGYGSEARDFYDVHVVADEHHQRVARNDLASRLAADEPGLAADIVLGAEAITAVEGAFARHLLRRWSEGASSLLVPLEVAQAA